MENGKNKSIKRLNKLKNGEKGIIISFIEKNIILNRHY